MWVSLGTIGRHTVHDHGRSTLYLRNVILKTRLSVCLSVCLFVCLSVCLPVCLSVCLYVCLSVCRRGLAIQTVLVPPCAMGREAGRRHQRNIGSPAVPSCGRRVLNNVVNPEDHKPFFCGGITVTKNSIKLEATAMRRDYGDAAQQHGSSSCSSSSNQQYSSSVFKFKLKNGIQLAEPNVQIHARGCWLFPIYGMYRYKRFTCRIRMNL